MLKYTFIALYADGSSLIQTQADTSEIDPEKRSAFYDFKHNGKEEICTEFLLKNEQDIECGVNLRTGEFSLYKINELPVSITVEGDEPEAGIPLRVVFFRRHRYDWVLPATFYNHKEAISHADGSYHVTNSIGDVTSFPHTVRVAQHYEQVKEDDTLVFDEYGNPKMNSILEIWPSEDTHTLVYDLGWQQTDSSGKERKKILTLT